MTTLDPAPGMVAYRLVDRHHDSIEVGSVLLRTSSHSHQKFGWGMYFCLTRKKVMARPPGCVT